MNIEARMESFSYAYVYALASQAGFAFKEEPRANDNVGVDISVNDPKRFFEIPSCRFSAQVKCVRKGKLQQKTNGIFYKLRKKNYDTLLKSCPGNTILLIVFVVPDNSIDWVVSNTSDTIIKHNCYWFCLQGYPPSTLQHEDSKEPIELSNAQLLTPQSFPSLMQKIANGEI